MNNSARGQFFEVLARLPARVWLQAALALVVFALLAFLGFALIAGIAAIVVLFVLGYKAKAWLLALFGDRGASPPSRRGGRKVIDVQYEIVERNDNERRG